MASLRSRPNARARRGLCALLCLALLLPLTACGAQTAEPSPTPGIQAPRDTAAQETPTAEPAPTPTPTPAPTPTPEPVQTEKPVTLLDALYGAGDYGGMPPAAYALMDPALPQADRIQQIRAWYTETETSAGSYEHRVYDDSFEAWWDGGALVKAAVTEALDPAAPGGTKYYYYYRDGSPYFAFITGYGAPGAELRLYFWNGGLIRWIESDHVTHDSDNARYAPYAGAAWRLYRILTELG